MIEMHLDETIQAPLYKQIVEQVRKLVATNQLQPGEHLPTVRQLAHSLHINPGTVVRAYLELEQERIVVSRRGGGTIVSTRSNDPQVLTLRQRHLSNIVSSNILETLSLGYSPEEIEAAFHLHLTRWREERKEKVEVLDNRDNKVDRRNTILIVGSHDLALNLLVSQLKHSNPEINIEVTHAGSLGGLIAIQEERADLAGIHLLDEGEKKVYAQTAIPYEAYKIELSMSPKFKRLLPLVLDVKHFTGIRIHRGNTAKDSAGCILPGENKVKGKVINSTKYEIGLIARMERAIKRGEDIQITIT